MSDIALRLYWLLMLLSCALTNSSIVSLFTQLARMAFGAHQQSAKPHLVSVFIRIWSIFGAPANSFKLNYQLLILGDVT